MFDLDKYEETLIAIRDNDLGELIADGFLNCVRICDTEFKKVASEFEQWGKQNRDKLDIYIYSNKEFWDTSISVIAILEDYYYNFGWYCYLNKSSIDEIELFRPDQHAKLPNFTNVYKRYSTLKNQIIISAKSDDDKKILSMFFNIREDYERILLLGLIRLGYYHCQSSKKRENNIIKFFENF